MAEVRCPMCGKANPAELDECRYCQARLRPIWDATSDSDPSLSPEDQASDLPEWLKSLRGPEDQAGLTFSPDQEAQSDHPDWLSQSRGLPGRPTDAPADETHSDFTAEPGDSSSSWLQDFLSESDSQSGLSLTSATGEIYPPNESGWSTRIGSTPIQEEQPPEASKSLDWMSRLELPADDLSPAAGEVRASPLLEPEEPLPDWLAHTEVESPILPGQEGIQPASEAEASLEPGQPETAAGGEELPARLGPAASESLEGQTPDDESEPEWVKLRPAESPDLQWVDDESLNWLDEKDEELPAWLFDQASPTEPAETAGASQADQESQPAAEIPAQELSSDTGEAISEPAGPALEAPEEELLPPTAEEPALAEALSEASPVGEQPATSEMVEAETHEPEALALAGAALAATSLEAAREAGQDQENELGWLGNLEDAYADLSLNATDESAAVLEGEEGFREEAGGALPVWLTKAAAAEEEQTAGPDEQAELKPAELPSWLQAMRPVGLVAAGGALASEKATLQVEGAGPLAGLRDALPAEPDVSHAQKPPVYSLKLQASDTQLVQAELLRGLVEGEGQPQALRSRPVISSHDFVRLIIAVLLIFPLLFVVLTGTPQFDLPAPSLGVDVVGKQIDALPAGAPVLLAVDYQPGFSGEMEAVAVPVVQHLLERSAYLATVSTLPTGPAQAERLLAQARGGDGPAFQSLVNSTNLGYIPGGAAGLLAFAQAPRDTLPTNLRGEQAWQAASLQNIATLDQFAMVIVATENPDIARYWIEQVQPYLGSAPLVMLLSAQVEPMVWPYYHANPAQVQGLVSGLAGAAGYQVRNVQTGAATQYWSPYSLGVWIAALLMVLGGGVYLVMAQLARQKEKAGGEKRP